MNSFEGMMAPTFAPFKQDGSLNLEVIPKYAKYLTEHGVKGIYVNGTSGEGLSMTIEERKLILETWVNEAKSTSLQVVAMIGGGCLKDTINLAKHAESCGVLGVATLPPLYDKPTTVEDLVDYCNEIAKAVPNVPLLYYHIPFKTGIKFPMDEFLKIGSELIPSLAGLKFTDHDVSEEGLRCLQLQNRKFVVFSGFDQDLMEALKLGYTCAINACFNLVPETAGKIFSISNKGKAEGNNAWHSEAEKLQGEINAFLESIFRFTGGFSVSAMKAAMTLISGIDVGPARKPNSQLSPEVVNQLKEVIQHSIIS